MPEGKNVRIRALEPADLECMLRWENDTENWGVTNTFIPFSRFTLKNYIDSIKDIYSDKQFRFVIELIAENKALGFIDLFEFDPFHQRAGVGILIGEKDERGKGYAAESLELLKSYCKNVLQLHCLYCSVGENNKSSLRLFQNAGFVITGKKENWFRNGDNWEDEYFMQYHFTEKS